MVINVVIADSTYMKLRPKLSGSELSIPERKLRDQLKQKRKRITFEIFAEAIEQTASRDRVMESDVRE